MFLDMLHEDGLLVTAKGLGIEEVIYSLIKVYSDPGSLVLVIGLSEDEEQYFRTRIHNEGIKALPKKVTSEYSSNERKLLYLDGGVLFVTTRILVVDMLTDTMPIPMISGMIVARAHQTAESCQEAFILRMYRQKNKTGFIKAFSSSPVSFTSGFCRAERVMKGLFVRNLYLWPRFHADVVSTMNQTTQPEVIELHINMTKEMITIQTSVLDLLNFSMQEIKRLNPSLTSNIDEKEELMSVENAISKTFYKLLQKELDPVWHQLSWRTKQLVEDMKTLHSILVYLTRYDCITFHAFVSALKTTDNAMKSGGWMILDAAENLFATAELRVFGETHSSGQIKDEKRQKLSLEELLVCEENPKWEALVEVLKEIKSELENNSCDLKESFPSEKVLVLTWDERVAQQLQDVLTTGSKALILRMYNRSLGEKYGFLFRDKDSKSKESNSGKPPVIQKESTIEKDSKESDHQLTLLQSPVTIIQSMHIGQFALYKLINELKPRYVILYDVQISAIRQLEVFQASNPDHKLKAYIMMYGNSTEEQAYLTSLRKEKEAFEKLIKDKATMVIPEHREGRDNDGENEQNPDLARNLSQKASDPAVEALGKSSRKGFDECSATPPKVIVDMREFRSDLPSILHKRGIDIEPVTLEVGDYIITPEMCIERKSISDLIGSLQSGRLYNQATAMTRFYTKPMLLIEFDHNKSFALQGKYYLSRDAAANDLVARLQLLTIHFPKVFLKYYLFF